jgi:hypothetical protein
LFAVVIVTVDVGSFVFAVVSVFAAALFAAGLVLLATVFAVVFLAVFVAAAVKKLAVGGGVGPPGALAGVGEGTLVAVLTFADVDAGGELVALDGLLRGLDGFGFIDGLLAVDELGRDLEPVEKRCGLLETDAVIDDGVADAGHGELDGGGIFRHGQLQGAELEVGLRTDGVDLGVVVAELAAPEGGGLAAEPVGLDVPAFHVHIRYPPPPPLFR